MTKFFICSLVLLLMIKAAGFNGSELKRFTASISEMTGKEPMSGTNTTAPHQEKNASHAPAMDETAHIHHFHKHRIKKMKKHHGKYWLVSQFLLVLCHLAILYIGYLHAIPH